MDLCGNVPDNAKKIITEKCRVVNICIFITPSIKGDIVTLTDRICKQLKTASEIWCECRIMFNVKRFRRLAEIVDTPSDFDFQADDIISAEKVRDHPLANNLWEFDPCCSDGPHVNLYYTAGTRFQSGESGVGIWETNAGNGRYFILIAEGATDTAILAHELGHVLGLNHDNSDPMNIMFPSPPGSIVTDDQCTQVNNPERHLIQEEFCETKFIGEFPKHFEVEILNMTVDEVDDGVDPDDDIEIRWNFKIENTGNSTSTNLSWEHHQIEDDAPNIPYHIGVRTVVVVDKATDIIKLNISGVEFDNGDDNNLPSTTREFDKTNNWGTNFPSPISLSNSEITCKIALKVTELAQEEQLIPGVCEGAIIGT